MSKAMLIESFVENIQENCDISDSRDHGIYSMCSMILKLRNLYKWEQGLEPWEEPEAADLLDWIEAKENYWATITEKSYTPLALNGKSHSPYETEKINPALDTDDVYYGAGYGRSMKSIFFLADVVEQRVVEGCPVLILGKERAKEMASPFAMAQNGLIIIKKEALRFFLWDQFQELRTSCRSSFQYLMKTYRLKPDGKLDQELLKKSLGRMVDNEMDLFIYHEVGEIVQKEFDTKTFQKIISRFPTSLTELVCRTIKDILADTDPRGPLAYIVREERDSSLGLYISLLDGMREKLFPEIFTGWQKFLDDGNFQHIEQARSDCRVKNLLFAKEIKRIAAGIGEVSDDMILEDFNQHIFTPLGLEQGQQPDNQSTQG